MKGPSGGFVWKWARRLTQILALLAILAAPLLGGWQRLDRTELAMWGSEGWNLPLGVRDELPLGDKPAKAYDSLHFIGGGLAVEYFSIPVSDPVSGTIAAVRGGFSGRTVLALALPFLLALFAGRMFCGWFCPFGVVARTLGYLLERVPWKHPRFRVPNRRPLRWIILGASVLASMLGVQVALFLFLPHLLMQQSAYSVWLLGGGGAILGALLGLIVAGLMFGPTLYCATLCPTGAVLGLVGRARLLRVTLAEPSACSSNCELCSRACWLHLQPDSGDPGQDCDNCLRCFDACPRDNMVVRPPSRRKLKKLPVIAAMLALATTLGTGVADAQVKAATKPTLLLSAEHVLDYVTVSVAIVDYTGVELLADEHSSLGGVGISVFIARGEYGEADERGLLASRDFYTGPITFEVHGRNGGVKARIGHKEPTSPISTPHRSIYRKRIALQIAAGDTLVIAPIPGWLERPLTLTVPPKGVAPSTGTTMWFFGGAFLLFGGLLALALAVPSRKSK
ncbi:MAG: 4Fe-4S binding protein [Myxococcales bacterium]|nr:4Fe-4S binding protein [Myxococcales bacterium]